VQQAIRAVDDKWWKQIGGATGPADRRWGEMQDSLADSLSAWRDNPLARRIVSLTTDYVVGDGITLTSTLPEVADFIRQLWTHPLNRLDLRLYAWCDELTRSGELFVVLATNPGNGLTYLRALPAARIDQIESDPDDLERELRYHELLPGDPAGRWWPAAELAPAREAAICHFAVNRPVGALRGESDLAPLLPWLRRYREWLEDRVRVNRLRNSFLWQVRLRHAAPGDVERKRMQYRQSPAPGSIIVSDENEEWQALSARLEGHEAESDGKALRLLVAAGAGVPLHFLSEGESATKATAAEMGGPTFRHYRHRQLQFAGMLMHLVGVAARRASAFGRLELPPDGDLHLSYTLPDLTRADNLQLAQALREAAEALGQLHDRGWIDRADAVRLAYRFAGETK
jgi:hypothetical protein